jgi:peptidoglycan-associated lipoprotein
MPMYVKLLSLGAGLLLLAACSSNDEGMSGTAAGAGMPVGAGAGSGGSGVSSTAMAGQPTPGSTQDFEVNVGDRVFFTFDSTTIDDKARETLSRQATWLQQYPGVIVTIEGHTDERGTREYNLALGERRATAARNYLEALGVPANRMTTISYGEERPADPSPTDEAYALNRRAVTVVNATN